MMEHHVFNRVIWLAFLTDVPELDRKIFRSATIPFDVSAQQMVARVLFNTAFVVAIVEANRTFSRSMRTLLRFSRKSGNHFIVFTAS